MSVRTFISPMSFLMTNSTNGSSKPCSYSFLSFSFTFSSTFLSFSSFLTFSFSSSFSSTFAFASTSAKSKTFSSLAFLSFTFAMASTFPTFTFILYSIHFHGLLSSCGRGILCCSWVLPISIFHPKVDTLELASNFVLSFHTQVRFPSLVHK